MTTTTRDPASTTAPQIGDDSDAGDYDDLIPLGRSMPVRVYLQSLWERRQFAISVPVGELRTQHMNTVLGNVWHLLNPMLQVGVYFLIFGLLLGTDRGIDNFITYLAIGVFSFGYMQRAIKACASSIIRRAPCLRQTSMSSASACLSRWPMPAGKKSAQGESGSSKLLT